MKATLNSDVEKHMNESGCNEQEAANELGLNSDEIYEYEDDDSDES